MIANDQFPFHFIHTQTELNTKIPEYMEDKTESTCFGLFCKLGEIQIAELEQGFLVVGKFPS